MGLWTASDGRFTIEEFQRLPLEGLRWELIAGAVVKMEPHAMDTSVLTASLTSAISNHAREFDLGHVLGAGCGYRSWPDQETVRVTDVSFTPDDRLPAERDPNDYPRWAPDLTVEVFSPFERMATVLGRIAMFLAAGTRMAWLVVPASGTVTVFRQDAILPTLGMDAPLDGAEVLPGFTIGLAELFSWTR